ncbi:MAG: DinB family protein [Ignavibacteriaceae bacterium]|nr:DinB family protein [Ignavibacteriaceae bacterium]
MSLSNVTLSRLKTQHEVVDVLISGRSESELKYRPIPDKWSAFENIAHLTCYQPRVIDRTKRILEEDNPTFPAYIPEEDPEFPKFIAMTVEQLLTHLNEKRSEIVKLIANLTEAELQRTGVHGKFGRMNLIDWTEFFLLHEAHHLHTIFKLIRSLRK